MARTVGLGNQRFDSILEHDDFYVDKTAFIQEWWDSGDIVTLITRPRRFGKTLNMSMLECFFSTRYAEREDLFEGLSVWKDERFRSLQGTYPVLFLSFASIKDNKNVQSVLLGINAVLAREFERNSFLLKAEILSENEKEEFLKVKTNMDFVTAVNAIQNLCIWLERYYGKKAIILLDEYDTPMQEAWVGGYWDEITGFYRSFFNATFKTNPSLERGVMTGITRISKESIFSGLNNVEVISTTSKKYETSFGFTEEEVKASLEEMGLADTFNEVKDWYDGFTFGLKADIYNPWSIINYLDKREFNTYWANTSSNDLINHLIKTGDAQVKTTMEDLLSEGVLKTHIDEQVIFSQLESKRNAIWSLLLASGYLKVVERPRLSSAGTREDTQYTLSITNKEVVLMFKDFIRDWFSDSDTRPVYNEFVKALKAGDIKSMNRFINKVAKHTFSCFDTGKGVSDTTQPERFYHGFILGLIVELQGEYLITSNRESGYGRYDVMLEPLKSEIPAYIFEFKALDEDDDEKLLEDTLVSARRQIREKDYAATLKARGIAPERIHELGFVFEGKRVLIG